MEAGKAWAAKMAARKVRVEAATGEADRGWAVAVVTAGEAAAPGLVGTAVGTAGATVAVATAAGSEARAAREVVATGAAPAADPEARAAREVTATRVALPAGAATALVPQREAR